MIKEQLNDPVNHPSHYTFGKFEVIDVLMDWFSTQPLLWQVGKYIARSKYKGNEVEDLKKARWYLDKQIAILQKIDQVEAKLHYCQKCYKLCCDDEVDLHKDYPTHINCGGNVVPNKHA